MERHFADRRTGLRPDRRAGRAVRARADGTFRAAHGQSQPGGPEHAGARPGNSRSGYGRPGAGRRRARTGRPDDANTARVAGSRTQRRRAKRQRTARAGRYNRRAERRWRRITGDRSRCAHSRRADTRTTAHPEPDQSQPALVGGGHSAGDATRPGATTAECDAARHIRPPALPAQQRARSILLIQALS